VTGQPLVFESFGVVAEVAADDPRLAEVLPPDWRPASGRPAARFELARDGTIALDGLVVERGGSLLRLGSLVRHHLAQQAPGHVFIHAGVVRLGGTTIVIPGSSHSGKTTLVAELVQAGATYYSDEYAPVDAAGLIHPYAKPLSVRAAGRNGMGDLVPVPVGRTGKEPSRAGLIVLTSYEPGARWRPRSLTPGEGALGLLEHTLPARARPGEALDVVSRLAQDAQVVAGPRGEASDVAEALLALAT
jgi:hypothetical protein